MNINSPGTRLKKLRLNARKTLDDQSKLFNVSLNSVYRWEHDLCVPRKSVLRRIANFYNVPFEWILNGEGTGVKILASDEENGENTGSENKEEENRCEGCILNPERNTEQKILKMIRKLPNNNKYKIIGYIERMCLEGDE